MSQCLAKIVIKSTQNFWHVKAYPCGQKKSFPTITNSRQMRRFKNHFSCTDDEVLATLVKRHRRKIGAEKEGTTKRAREQERKQSEFF